MPPPATRGRPSQSVKKKGLPKLPARACWVTCQGAWALEEECLCESAASNCAHMHMHAGEERCESRQRTRRPHPPPRAEPVPLRTHPPQSPCMMAAMPGKTTHARALPRSCPCLPHPCLIAEQQTCAKAHAYRAPAVKLRADTRLRPCLPGPRLVAEDGDCVQVHPQHMLHLVSHLSMRSERGEAGRWGVVVIHESGERSTRGEALREAARGMVEDKASCANDQVTERRASGIDRLALILMWPVFLVDRPMLVQKKAGSGACPRGQFAAAWADSRPFPFESGRCSWRGGAGLVPRPFKRHALYNAHLKGRARAVCLSARRSQTRPLFLLKVGDVSRKRLNTLCPAWYWCA
jgi:hypothetical protein